MTEQEANDELRKRNQKLGRYLLSRRILKWLNSDKKREFRLNSRDYSGESHSIGSTSEEED